MGKRVKTGNHKMSEIQEPSEAEVEAAAKALAVNEGYEISGLRAGRYENFAHTWADFLDLARAALRAAARVRKEQGNG